MHNQNIMSLLVGLAVDAEPSARMFAFQTLSVKAQDKVDISAALATLQSGLSDENKAVKRNSGEALAHHFVNQHKWPDLDELSHHDDVSVRHGLAWAIENCANRFHHVSLGGDAQRGLAKAKKIAAALMPAIRALLCDKEADIKNIAFAALENAAELVEISSAISQAISGLTDKDSNVRLHAAGAFANAACNKTDISPAFPALTRLLSDESYRTQEQAAHALGYAAQHGADISRSVDALAYRITDDGQTLSGTCAWALREFAENDGGQTATLQHRATSARTSGAKLQPVPRQISHAALVVERLRQPTIDRELQTVISLINKCKVLIQCP